MGKSESTKELCPGVVLGHEGCRHLIPLGRIFHAQQRQGMPVFTVAASVDPFLLQQEVGPVTGQTADLVAKVNVPASSKSMALSRGKAHGIRVEGRDLTGRKGGPIFVRTRPRRPGRILRGASMAPHEVASLEWLTRRPFLLAPNRVYRVYKGGALLERLQGKPQSEDDHFPEDWVGSTTVSRLAGRPPDEGLSRVRTPDGSVVVLKSLIERFPEAMLGAAHVARYAAELGVLCKLLDAAMRLPIQCHPDRAFARQYLQSDYGKTESWLILATRTIDGIPPSILFGFREGVTAEAFQRMVQTQDIPAQVEALNRLEVKPGEVYLVSAGTPHAIGAGVFMVEVQEPTDFVVNTEYTVGNIRRTEAQCFMGLGFDLGMRCFNYEAVGMEYVRQHTPLPRIIWESGGAREEILIGPENTPCFGAARLTIRGTVPDRDKGRCYIGIVTEGKGGLTGPGLSLALQAGATFFVPAASRHESYQATPGDPLTVIKCFPPSA